MRILRGLIGAFVGGLVGCGYGIGLASLLAPVPDKLVHEWYIMAVYAYTFFSAVGGAIIGAGVGAIGCREALVGAGIGCLLGTGVGWVMWVTDSPPHRSYTGMTIVYSALFCSLVGASVGWLGSIQP